jgi:hypothetical protein
MKTKIWFSIVLVVAGLAALPLYGQTFPPKGDDSVQSFGKFWILIDPPYQAMFAGCPAYNPTTHVLESPTLYEPTTVIGRSAPIKEGSPGDNGGVPVGSANTMVRDAGMVVPPSLTPIAPHSNEVHTEIRHLNMVTFGGGPMARVRAGVCYNSTTCSPTSPPPPNRISRGEVVSNHAPAGAPPDFPARSYFNVFAQIDIPACGGFPGATVYNKAPLLVHTPSIASFPPSGVVYMHDSSSAIAVFMSHGAKWEKGKRRLGCVILAGHGIIPTFHRAATLDEAPTATQVSLQKGQAAPQREYEREQKVRPPDKHEVEQEAEKFQEHMKREHEREGGRHRDCGPTGKDDDKDD